jgi:hypothetical protein
MDMTDGSIVSVTDYSTPYLSNSSLVTTVNDLVEQLEESVGGTVDQVNTNTNDIAQMKVTFQDGVDAVYNAVVAEGVPPASSTPTDIAAAIAQIRTPNRGAWTGAGTPSGNNSVNVAIPAGYHNGNGYVTANGGTAWNNGRNQGRADKQTDYYEIIATRTSSSGGWGQYQLYLQQNSVTIATLGTTSLADSGGTITLGSCNIAHSFKGLGNNA